MAIKVTSVSKSFGNFKALDNISFELNKGEIVGFLGPNGAGKSTTMKIVCGYTKPSAGTTCINDKDVQEHPIQIKKELGYLPENNPLYLDLYVREYIRFIAQVNHIKKPNQRIEWLLEQLDIGSEANKKLGQLSKGYRQRIGLVGALINNPSVLVLDEPTTGLDPNQAKSFRAVIRSLAQEKTILFSSHILSEVEAICEKCIIINKGKIIANDSFSNLKKREGRKQKIIVIQFEDNHSSFPFEAFQTYFPSLSINMVSRNELELDAKLTNDIHAKINTFFKTHSIQLLGIRQKSIAVEELFSMLTTK